MCGIAGIISKDSRIGELEKPLIRMQAALAHRGPDDQGIYVSQDKFVYLAHTRLSIIDLSSAGHQPMSSAKERFWIIFNGEIYNYKEIRLRLQSKGVEFKSQTDTEVILKLYEEKGAECLQELRGMFAFAIWDDLEKTCFLARDHFGIKPLYYCQAMHAFVFASEVRAVLSSGFVTKNIDINGLSGYLRSGYVSEPHTLIKDIHCLEAGHWLLWKEGNLTKKKYWQINFSREEFSISEAVERTRELLSGSIDHHFVSDVPVGVFLSGGIDSSSIVALASQKRGGRLNTYSIVFNESKNNDMLASRIMAHKFRTNHTELNLSARAAKEMFPDFLDSIDQPSIDGFNTYCVSRLAHENGVKVILSGLGGDELFAGAYRTFQLLPKIVNLNRKLIFLKPFHAGLGRILSVFKFQKAKRIGDFLQNDINAVSTYNFLRSGLFCAREVTEIIDYYFPGIYQTYTPNTETLPVFPSLEDDVSFLELSYYLRNQLLRDSDVMSMRWGLELRVPFIDRVLFEGISSIPNNIRLAYGKKLLIKSVPELPTEVFKRAKQGFSFPLQGWANNEWRGYLSEFKYPEDIFLNSWYRRMSLAVFQRWWNNIGK